ncbi:MAG: thioesterase family protein [Azonexus sp.]|jgi:4-hydroxybenzoyl-CoA thioesterase|nr:thioesterase family protein [Azonexus sp.]
MPRIKIDLPERFTFATEVPIYVSHINKAGHLDNVALLALVTEARMRFFRALGYDDELEVDGVGVILADATLQYRAEAFYGETMVIEIAATDFNKYGCDIVWRVSDKAGGREVARGKHGIMFFDYAARKPAGAPPGFLARLGV